MDNQTKKDLIFIQIATVIGFASVCGIFWYLDGGNPTEEIVNTEITIPEYKLDKNKDNSRIESYQAALAIEQQNQEVQNAQREFNTFDFFETAEEQQEEINIDDKIAQLESKIGEDANKEPERSSDKEIEKKATPVIRHVRKKESASHETNEEKNRRIIEDKRKQLIYKNKKQLFSTGVLVDDDMCFIRQLTPEEVAMGYDVFVANEEKKQIPHNNTAVAAAINNNKHQKKNGFKPMEENTSTIREKGAIRAVVNGEQKNITTSSQVQLRILDEIEIEGTTIPRNTIIYGRAQFQNNRMGIYIENITYNNNIYPFQGKIYDKDGFEGLYVPDNLINDVTKESSSNSISNSSGVNQMSSGVATGNVGNVLVGAVRTTASSIKNATSNRIKESKITLPANYKILIKVK